jgi:putative membrane protein
VVRLVIAKSVVGRLRGPTDGAARWTTPVLAALILVGFDAVSDASVTTLVRPDTYTFPGGYNGVPFTNFVGWIVTGWVIFQVFAALEARVSTPAPSSTALTSSLHYHLVPVVVWALVPVGHFALTPNFAERTVSGIISVAWSAEDHRNSFAC